MKEFEILGKPIREPVKKLETFPAPKGCARVTMKTEEFTSLCPVTGQPDYYTVIIDYIPDEKCLESKSLKLYLWTFREQGSFCESLASQIADDIYEVLRPLKLQVTLASTPRGGISIQAVAEK